MTDRMIDAEQPEPLAGLHGGTTILVNDRMRGLTGVFKGVMIIDDRTRYIVTVTDTVRSRFEVGAPVSDWVANWRQA